MAEKDKTPKTEEIKGLGENENKTYQNLDRLNKETSKINDQFVSWKDQLQSVAGVVGTIQGAWSKFQGVTAAIDQYTIMNDQLARVNKSSLSTLEVQKQLTAAANSSRVPYEQLAQTVLALTNGNEGLFSAADLSGTAEFVTLYQQAIKASSLDANHLAQSLGSFTSIMSSGSDWLSGAQLGELIDQSYVLKEIFGDISQGMSMEQFIGTLQDNADKITTAFDSAPQTFAESFIQVKNVLLEAISPAMERLAELAKSEQFQTFITVICNGLLLIGTILGGVASFFVEHIEILGPIIIGVITAILAWKAVMGVMNTAVAMVDISTRLFGNTLKAIPLIMIISLIAALVGMIISLWQTNEGFRNAIYTIWNGIMAFFSHIPEFFFWLIDVIVTFFENRMTDVVSFLAGVVNAIIKGINFVIKGLNYLPGVDIPLLAEVTWGEDFADMMKERQEQRDQMTASMGQWADNNVQGWKTLEEQYEAKLAGDNSVGTTDNSSLVAQSFGDKQEVVVEKVEPVINNTFTGDINSEQDFDRLIQQMTNSLWNNTQVSANKAISVW